MKSTDEINKLTEILNDESKDLSTRVMAGDTLRYAYVQPATYDYDTAFAVAKQVIALGTQALKAKADLTIYNALERAYITTARDDFNDYMLALEWNRPMKERFYQPRKKIFRSIADDMTDMFVHDDYVIYMLSCPPRVGKSSWGLFVISWIIGRNPNDPILMTGYAEKITKMFYNGLTETYENSDYNYHAIFPKVQLVDTSAKDLTLDFRDDGKQSTRKYKTTTCRAIDGSLTGATEARQLLYCDDLVRDIEEALNPARLQSLREKLVTNVYSRKKQGCKEIHIGTRWSVHDPLGYVERMNADNPRCKVIRIPALDEETGESNFDYDYGVGFDTAYYEDLKRHEDDVTWQCVYQQNPIEREGLLFPKDDLKYTFAVPDTTHNPPDDIFAWCDVAFGGEDNLALWIAYQYGNDDPIIVDCVYHKGDYMETEPIVAGHLIQYGVRRAIFEANNGGDFYARDVDATIKERGYRLNITSQRAASTKSKETRIIQYSPDIRGFTYLHDSVAPAMYNRAMVDLNTYTMSGKNQHDDAPDGLAGLASMMRMNLNASVKIFDRSNI